MTNKAYAYTEQRAEQYSHHAASNFPELHQPFTAPYTWLKARFYMEMSAIVVYLLLKTNIHPNTVTFVYGISGLVAGGLIATANAYCVIAGVIIFFTRGVLDWSDGHYARKIGKTSSTGHILDVYGAILGSVGLGFGLGFFVASRTGYEFIYYLVALLPIFRALLLSNYGQSILLRHMIVKDYSDFELKEKAFSDNNMCESSWFKKLYKFIYSFMDDRARTVDFIGMTLLVDLYLSTNYTLYVFIALFAKWLIAYFGSLYVVMRGGWVEREHESVIRSVLKCQSSHDAAE